MRINLPFRLNRLRQNGPPPDRALILRIFARLTRSRLRRGVLRSANTPEAAIASFIAPHTRTETKLFIRRADPVPISAARNRGRQMPH